jgi:hypothetical protein
MILEIIANARILTTLNTNYPRGRRKLNVRCFAPGSITGTDRNPISIGNRFI